jgi:lysine 2,3-aminomutase
MDDFRDWKWQLRNRITTIEGLRTYITPTPEEEQAIADTADIFHFSVTPYYLSLIDADNPKCPIRRQVIPLPDELAPDIVGVEDPLEEVAHSPVKNLIHNYPDRVAFCVTSECAIYCRFCLRKRMVGDSAFMMRKSELRDALDYIRRTPAIRDVLLTGGDPLIFGDAQLDWLLGELRSISRVEIIRIGSRMPVKLPFRITPDLCDVLKKHGPIWLNTHFNHPSELTDDVADAVDRLLTAGVPVGNQTVLLRGINNSVDTMRTLCNGLVRLRIRPYYLYQAQLIAGTAHLRTTVEEGLSIVESLQGSITGFAIPRYVLDTPFGKVPLDRSWILGRHGDLVIMRTTRDSLWAEPNPLDRVDDRPEARQWPRLPEIDIPAGTYSLLDGKVAVVE